MSECRTAEYCAGESRSSSRASPSSVPDTVSPVMRATATPPSSPEPEEARKRRRRLAGFAALVAVALSLIACSPSLAAQPHGHAEGQARRRHHAREPLLRLDARLALQAGDQAEGARHHQGQGDLRRPDRQGVQPGGQRRRLEQDLPGVADPEELLQGARRRRQALQAPRHRPLGGGRTDNWQIFGCNGTRYQCSPQYEDGRLSRRLLRRSSNRATNRRRT